MGNRAGRGRKRKADDRNEPNNDWSDQDNDRAIQQGNGAGGIEHESQEEPPAQDRQVNQMVGDDGSALGPSGDIYDEDAEPEIGEIEDQNQGQGGKQKASKINDQANQAGRRRGPAKRGRGNPCGREKQYPVPTRRSTRRASVTSGRDDVSHVSTLTNQ